MKSKAVVIVAFSALVSTLSCAQEKSKNRKLKVSSVSIANGISSSNTFNNSFYYSSIARSNDLIHHNRAAVLYNTSPSVLLSFKTYSRSKQAYNPNRELRLGAGFSTNRSSTNSHHEYDTYSNLVITKTSTNYIDNCIHIDGAYIYKTDPDKRFSFYFGHGLIIGKSISTSRFISQVKSYYDQYGLQEEIATLTYEDDYYTTGSMYTEIYMPFGLSFRVSQTKQLLKDFTIFAEGRAGLRNTSYKGSPFYLRSTSNVTFGVNYRFNNG